MGRTRTGPGLITASIDVTERQRLRRDMLRVQEEERRRLGRDLHDGVASHLTGVAISLSVLARRIEDGDLVPDVLAGEVQKIRRLVDESAQEVRRLSRGLAPAGLSGEGVVGALKRLAENTDGARFEVDPDLPMLEDEAAGHLYWIAQEAVVNARKYAGARVIALRLARRDGGLVLEVEDDGRGFAPERVGMDGLGLRTMRYRAELLGAHLTIDAAPGQGTRIVCDLPVGGPAP